MRARTRLNQARGEEWSKKRGSKREGSRESNERGGHRDRGREHERKERLWPENTKPIEVQNRFFEMNPPIAIKFQCILMLAVHMQRQSNRVKPEDDLNKKFKCVK